VATLVRERRALVALSDHRHILAGLLLSVAAVAAVSGAVHFVRPHAPVFSLATLYILAVLPVAVLWGRTLALVVSLVSVLVFNFFFVPPTLTFTLSGEENWLVFVVCLVTGLLVSDLAARARRRAREAEQREREAALLAEVATTLLSGAAADAELPRIAEATASVLQIPSARIELGEAAGRTGAEGGIPLLAGERYVGTLYVEAGSEPHAEAGRRFLPALASLLAIAGDREQLAREVLETEALRRSDALKTALLRSVSHDLRSPLTAIRASLEALESSDLELTESDREELLRSARAETRRLDRVVRNLLDLSRLQAGAARPDSRLRTVEGLLDQALRDVAGLDGRVEVRLEADLPLIEVDPIQIEHALANLLDNALKFSAPDGLVTVRVERRAKEISIHVDDEGPGLKTADLRLIFEPFRHAAGMSGRKGAGLGLTIAKGFVEANGGRIWAESRPGGGASFVAAFPAALEPVRSEA
jgi:two-component system sensor histidine kinase KdpD